NPPIVIRRIKSPRSRMALPSCVVSNGPQQDASHSGTLSAGVGLGEGYGAGLGDGHVEGFDTWKAELLVLPVDALQHMELDRRPLIGARFRSEEHTSELQSPD